MCNNFGNLGDYLVNEQVLLLVGLKVRKWQEKRASRWKSKYLHPGAFSDGHDSVLFRMQQRLVVRLSPPYNLYPRHSQPITIIAYIIHM